MRTYPRSRIDLRVEERLNSSPQKGCIELNGITLEHEGSAQNRGLISFLPSLRNHYQTQKYSKQPRNRVFGHTTMYHKVHK
jgi:uncharacterized protein YccT (UPF0319 family)